MSDYLVIDGIYSILNSGELEELLKNTNITAVDNNISSLEEMNSLFEKSILDLNNLIGVKSFIPINNYVYVYRGMPFLFINVYGINEAIKDIEKKIKKVDLYLDKNQGEFSQIAIGFHGALRIEYINNYYWTLPEEDRRAYFRDVYTSLEYGFEYLNGDIFEDAFSLNGEEKHF